MKVVINTCYGGFGLSNKAYEKLIDYGIPTEDYSEEKDLNGEYDEKKIIFKSIIPHIKYFDSFLSEDRTNELLIKVIENLDKEANGPHAKLKIVEIPDDVNYIIEEYDGLEHIAEVHRTWR